MKIKYLQKGNQIWRGVLVNDSQESMAAIRELTGWLPKLNMNGRLKVYMTKDQYVIVSQGDWFLLDDKRQAMLATKETIEAQFTEVGQRVSNTVLPANSGMTWDEALRKSAHNEAHYHSLSLMLDKQDVFDWCKKAAELLANESVKADRRIIKTSCVHYSREHISFDLQLFDSLSLPFPEKP